MGAEETEPWGPPLSSSRCCSSYQHPSLLLNGLSFNKELSKDLLKRGETTMSISSTDLICGGWKTSMRMRMEILGREDLQRKKAEEITMNISSTALICGGWKTSMSRQKEFRRLKKPQRVNTVVFIISFIKI